MYESIFCVLCALYFAYLYNTETRLGALKFMWLITSLMSVVAGTLLDTSLITATYNPISYITTYAYGVTGQLTPLTEAYGFVVFIVLMYLFYRVYKETGSLFGLKLWD